MGYGKEGEFNPDALKKIADFNGGYYSQGNPGNNFTFNGRFAGRVLKKIGNFSSVLNHMLQI